MASAAPIAATQNVPGPGPSHWTNWKVEYAPSM